MLPASWQGAASGDAKWTVMVYMGAGNVKNAETLVEAGNADLEEMRSVGSGDSLNIFVQVHRGGDFVPRRGRITQGMAAGMDGLEEVPECQRNTSRGHALEWFIATALEEAHHNP